VTAIAWTLVGLMAGSLGVLSTALFAGLARIDGVGTSVAGRIDALGTRIDALGTRLDSRIDALGDDLRAEIRDLRTTVHDLHVRLTRAGG
jgi:hypothetical protein